MSVCSGFKHLSESGSLRRVTTGGDNNPVVGDLNPEWKQCAAAAGSAGAFTGIRLVKGAVGPAFEKSAVVAEELVRPPIERCSGMDAVVDIGVVASAEVNYETFDNPLSPENVKFRRAAGRDFAQRRRPNGRVRHWITRDPGRFHYEDEIGVRATLVGLDESARAIRNWYLWLLGRRRFTSTGNTLTVRPIAGRFHRSFLVPS